MSTNDSGISDKKEPRVLAWFSCGDASAVACAIALQEYANVVVIRIHLPTEHKDNDRFASNCEKWYGIDIKVLRDPAGRTTWDVWEKRKYIAGIAGAPCTGELKKKLRFGFQRADDLHVLGFTVEEQRRADRFRKNNCELDVTFPLIDAKLTKADCHAIVRARGIELPAMYLLGFDNNNCIGCPKGGAGYWNMIRKHFPSEFSRMEELSRRLGARLIRQDGKRIFLDELRPNTGRQKDAPIITCSAFCEEIVEHLD